ncbi:WD40 repeat domain-containing protein [Catellatospora bangladeshensis]|uniref:WD40 repeat domain-containing protein n=1 Tax=Catellatospora bangladeshensis TaxID=310355 RepID=UPI003610AC32
MGAVWTWAEPDGGARLVTAGADGVICRWDLDRVAPMEPALRGHEGGIWAVTGWTDAQGEVRLATSGQDGTVRLWDPRRARAVRTLEIGPVSIWGVSDAPTKRDVIGRQALAEAIAQQIRHPGGGPAGDGPRWWASKGHGDAARARS